MAASHRWLPLPHPRAASLVLGGEAHALTSEHELPGTHSGAGRSRRQKMTAESTKASSPKPNSTPL